jgi:hypothetical protein
MKIALTLCLNLAFLVPGKLSPGAIATGICSRGTWSKMVALDISPALSEGVSSVGLPVGNEDSGFVVDKATGRGGRRTRGGRVASRSLDCAGDHGRNAAWAVFSIVGEASGDVSGVILARLASLDHGAKEAIDSGVKLGALPSDHSELEAVLARVIVLGLVANIEDTKEVFREKQDLSAGAFRSRTRAMTSQTLWLTRRK